MKAKWKFNHAPTFQDDRAVGAELVASDGTILAACLFSAGEMDTRSDGCGVWGMSRREVEWPDEEEALSAVWGKHARVSRS